MRAWNSRRVGPGVCSNSECANSGWVKTTGPGRRSPRRARSRATRAADRVGIDVERPSAIRSACTFGPEEGGDEHDPRARRDRGSRGVPRSTRSTGGRCRGRAAGPTSARRAPGGRAPATSSGLPPPAVASCRARSTAASTGSPSRASVDRLELRQGTEPDGRHPRLGAEPRDPGGRPAWGSSARWPRSAWAHARRRTGRRDGAAGRGWRRRPSRRRRRADGGLVAGEVDHEPGEREQVAAAPRSAALGDAPTRAMSSNALVVTTSSSSAGGAARRSGAPSPRTATRAAGGRRGRGARSSGRASRWCRSGGPRRAPPTRDGSCRSPRRPRPGRGARTLVTRA